MKILGFAPHWYREQPAYVAKIIWFGATKCQWWRILRLTVCRRKGHSQGNVARLLGMCDRCKADLTTDESRAFLREMLEDES